MAKKIKVKSPTAVANYKSSAVAPAAYTPGTYKSQYQNRLDAALDTVTNWKYDPMQDASYQALAKVYGARGNIAAKNTLADAAALNGGYGTSYAVSAAQQARNQYNQELAALIPDLENTAYNRATGTLSALRAADDTAYGRFRDTESDRQWKYSQDYQAYRDKEADNQWSWTQQYNKYRDLMSDYQWGTNYNYQIDRDKVTDTHWQKEYDLSKKGSSGGGGGGGGRRSSGGGYSSGYTSSTSGGGSAPVSQGKFRPAKYGGINSTTTKNKNKIRSRHAGVQS